MLLPITINIPYINMSTIKCIRHHWVESLHLSAISACIPFARSAIKKVRGTHRQHSHQYSATALSSINFEIT